MPESTMRTVTDAEVVKRDKIISLIREGANLIAELKQELKEVREVREGLIRTLMDMFPERPQGDAGE